MCKKIFNLMKDEFEMSTMGELKFFLGLLIIQKDDEDEKGNDSPKREYKG